MRIGVTLCALALVPAPPALAADDPVTFKDLRLPKSGDRERIEINDSTVTRTTTTVAGKPPDNQSSRSTITTTYTVEYLGSEANPLAKQIVAFEKAARGEDGRPVPLRLGGKKVVVELRGGKTGYRMSNGDDVEGNELEFLRSHFDDTTDNSSNSGGGSGGSLMSAFWPKKAVSVNKSWPADTEFLAKQALSAFEGLTLDPDQSRGQGTLLKVYDLDGVRYARIKIEAKLAVVRNEGKDYVMKFNPPLIAEFAGTYDLCIDGTTGNITGDVKWSARGTAKVKSGDGEETLKMDISGTTYKKYTLLKK